MYFPALLFLFFITLAMIIAGFSNGKTEAFFLLIWAFAALHHAVLLTGAADGLKNTSPQRLAAVILQHISYERSRETAQSACLNINGFFMLWLFCAGLWAMRSMMPDVSIAQDVGDRLLQAEMQHVLHQSVSDIQLQTAQSPYQTLARLCFPALYAAAFITFLTAPLHRHQTAALTMVVLIIFSICAAIVFKEPALRNVDIFDAVAGLAVLAVPFGVCVYGYARGRLKLWQILAAIMITTGFIGASLVGTGPDVAHKGLYLSGWTAWAMLWHMAQAPGRKRMRLYR